jgi:hypothetical protein
MDTPMGNSGFGSTPATDDGIGTGGSTGTCDRCGKSLHGSGSNAAGLEQFLGRLGLSDDMIDNLRTSMANVDVDEYLNTARDYLRDHSGKAKEYAKENPGKIAAGMAVLAVGAGLLISALNRD